MGSALSFAAVAIGASLGAWLRWCLSLWLNARVENLPLGTLLANIAGGFMIGIAVGVFENFPELPPEWRLLVITGFLGGLTTFSTFSAESVILLQRGAYGWVLLHTGLHLLGSIAACIAGLAVWRQVYP
ncbi:MAG: fluoride efflux transporter CrcB [Oxalobacteraceae bacterium]